MKTSRIPEKNGQRWALSKNNKITFAELRVVLQRAAQGAGKELILKL